MSTDQQRNHVGWGHRLRKENRGLREKIADLRKELGRVQRDLHSTWKLAEDIPCGLILVQQKKILFANEMASSELGYAREEMLSMDVSDLLDPDAISFAASLHQGKTGDQPPSIRHETSLTTKEGEILSAELRANKTLYKGKTAFLIHIISIDQRKAQEKQRRQSVKAEALGRMASGFRRELELWNILRQEGISRIQGLDSHEDSDLPSFRTIETIREKEARLSQDLHCLTRDEYDPSEMALLDLKNIIKTAVEISRPEITAGPDVNMDDVTIKTFLRAASPVYGCKDELQGVFVNIIRNGLEAIQHGGDIYLTSEEHSGLAHIYIQDNGTGMPEEIIGKIFDPFFTTKYGTRRGLGLSLSHAIVARHQGEISVTSEEGRGSAFVVRLPLARDVSLFTTAASGKEIRNSNFLFIGNEGVMTGILYSLIAERGGSITTASSYREGLGALRDTRFDLVIADHNLSPADTAGVIHRIKELWPDLPVALINSHGTPGSRNRREETGADLTMGRPLDVDRFLSLVSGLLAEGVSSI